MAYEQILTERRGAVELITLNKPEKLNAWSATLSGEMLEAIAQANADPGVGAVVLTGAGRAYCAGADISGWQRDINSVGSPAARDSNADTRRPQNLVRFFQQSKPIIVGVNGAAVGVGLTHILAADIRIASDQARFGAFFARMGLVPELASSHLLAQIVGLGNALDLCLTARMIDADEALRLGMVSKVVPQERLLEETLAVANTVAALPPSSLSMIKDLFARNAVDGDVETVMAREGDSLRLAYQSPEFKEAVAAFMEKRQPNYRAAAAGAAG